MKLTKTMTVLSAGLLLALAVGAATPKPSTASSTPADKATATDKSSPGSKSSPTAAAKPNDSDLAVPMEDQAPAAVPTPANNNPPKPVLYMTEQQLYTANGKNWIRYRYDVLNKNAYPAAMFAAAPSLPPCGSNTNASRTWVDFFDSTGKRLYGFCALSNPADLGKIWFAMEEGVIPPSYVYIELNDRQTNTKYKSNLADTTL
jgi:hypothetical protein